MGDRIGRTNDPDREKWVTAQLAKIPRGQRLIDIGAGELRFKPAAAHLRYVSQDFGRYDGAGDGRGLQTGGFDQSRIDIVSDLTEIPEPDRSFDAALCTEVLEHVPDPISALAEMARLLRPGGRLILTTPFVSFTHYSPYHFHTGFSRYWYEHWLPAKGFRILELEPAGDRGFFDFVAQEIDRLPWVWGRYSHSNALVKRVVGFALRVVSLVAARGLAELEARAASSSDFATHRWVCVAERI